MTAFERAQRFIGEVRELPGGQHHPLIQWFHLLCGFGPDTADEVPWCSSFVNACCWLERLPRSKSAMARSWLGVGIAVPLAEARPGQDVVILKRGEPPSGHVGFFAGVDWSTNRVSVLGGNQGNTVSVLEFPVSDVLGVRRLA